MESTASNSWKLVNEQPLLVDEYNQILLPDELKKYKADDPALAGLTTSKQAYKVNDLKLYLLETLQKGNTLKNPILEQYLNNLQYALTYGTKFDIEKQEVEKLDNFVNKYQSIDPQTNEFLGFYREDYADTLEQLKTLINQDAEMLQQGGTRKFNFKDFTYSGYAQFPYLHGEQLDLGNIDNFKTVLPKFPFLTSDYKMYKKIDGYQFHIKAYEDEAYSVVTVVLASQLGKVLQLPCEESFFANLSGQLVTATVHKPCLSLFENSYLELIPLSDSYETQDELKKVFYFLIQNWLAYTNEIVQVNQNTSSGRNVYRERFENHYIDTYGNVFLTEHQNCTFLTPAQLTEEFMVKLSIDSFNYQLIQTFYDRVKHLKIGSMVFDSIPDVYVRLHDDEAKSHNRPTFMQRKQAFESNWEALEKALDIFRKRGMI